MRAGSQEKDKSAILSRGALLRKKNCIYTGTNGHILIFFLEGFQIQQIKMQDTTPPAKFELKINSG